MKFRFCGNRIFQWLLHFVPSVLAFCYCEKQIDISFLCVCPLVEALPDRFLYLFGLAKRFEGKWNFRSLRVQKIYMSYTAKPTETIRIWNCLKANEFDNFPEFQSFFVHWKCACLSCCNQMNPCSSSRVWRLLFKVFTNIYQCFFESQECGMINTICFQGGSQTFLITEVAIRGIWGHATPEKFEI